MGLLNSKKIFKAILLATLICVSAFISINYFANIILLDILNKNPDSAYNIENEKISFSLVHQSIIMNGVIAKKRPDNEKTTAVLKATIEKLKIEGFSIYNLLFKQRITARKLLIENPYLEITSVKKNKRVADNSKSINLFWQDLTKNTLIKTIEIVNGEIKIYKNKQIGYYTKNIYLNLKDVRLNIENSNNPLPFLYSAINLKAGKTYNKINELYQAEISSFTVTNTGLSIDGIKIKPTLTKEAFSNKIKVEQDYTSCTIDHVELEDTQWNFKRDSLYIKAKNLTIQKLETILYRDKSVADNLSKKKLYARVLRELPFYINLDHFSVSEGALTYQEKQNNKNTPGEINFENIKLKGSHLNNFKYKTDSIPTKIKFEALLFGKSPILADLYFHIKNPLDSYRLKGTLKQFNTPDLNILTKPMFNIKTKGHIQKLDFLINGSDYDASATVNMVYRDLKIIYGEDKLGHKILNQIVNLVVKKNRTQEEAKSVQVYVKRDQQKSMYNQIIKCFVAALKKTLI